VANSLRNRIDQRGDDVVQEFSASTRFAGREVISYREVPVSGGPIRWYLLVSAGLQVSVGCQDGSAGETIDEQCRIAVGSVRVDGP
jgi:type VII secretion-associated protein (TIGR03931 family)